MLVNLACLLVVQIDESAKGGRKGGDGGPKQFGKLLHVPEKKSKSSPDRQSKNQRKYQKYQKQLQQQQQQQDDLVVKDVDAMGQTITNNNDNDNDNEGESDIGVEQKQRKYALKGSKVSCSECGKRVSKTDVKKLPCVLKNLHNGKKITAGAMMTSIRAFHNLLSFQLLMLFCC